MNEYNHQRGNLSTNPLRAADRQPRYKSNYIVDGAVALWLRTPGCLPFTQMKWQCRKKNCHQNDGERNVWIVFDRFEG